MHSCDQVEMQHFQAHQTVGTDVPKYFRLCCEKYFQPKDVLMADYSGHGGLFLQVLEGVPCEIYPFLCHSAKEIHNSLPIETIKQFKKFPYRYTTIVLCALMKVKFHLTLAPSHLSNNGGLLIFSSLKEFQHSIFLVFNIRNQIRISKIYKVEILKYFYIC